ncbi:hypothetical protein [Roseovarius nanhaiticus]|uniref:hypothetical protein n=1 Tax=Roseovarius nanhaiticus TaxID=573024 RepID=UPI00248F6F51|nr:hypothetical protein [Roseovarius nanhaiticus]
MIHQPSHREFLIDLVTEALGQARITHQQLFNSVIPSLPAQRRLFAEEIMHRLRRDNLFDEAFIRDLAAFVESLEREISDGTDVAWIADECNTAGGHHIRRLDHRAQALRCGAQALATLRDMIEEVLDAIKASDLIDDLL